MESIIMEATKSTPYICFDAQSHKLQINGESYPENAFEFYEPLISWIDQYIKQCAIPTILDLQLTYLNTSSTRCMLHLFDVLEEAYNSGKDISVNWYYHPDDDRSIEAGSEFKEDLSFPFAIKSIEDIIGDTY
jgi:hypothetical protein